MVLMNYHEMTMNEPRNSKARQQQFLVICAVMAGFFVHTLLTSGALESIQPTVGIFPGGYYAFKFSNRDYAASMGLGRTIAKDIMDYDKQTKLNEAEQPIIPEKSSSPTINAQTEVIQQMTYHIYLDDPTIMGGRRQRWMTGIMTGDEHKDKVDHLLALNDVQKLRPITKHEYLHWSAKEVFEKIPYEYVDLPSVDALVLQFPFTNGFVSALMFSYRILPAMRKMAVEKGEPGNIPVVISNCSKEQQMCTHYAPLVQGETFLLGRPTTEQHQEALGPEHFLDVKGMKEGLIKLLPMLEPYLK